MIDAKTIDSLTLLHFKNFKARERWCYLVKYEYFSNQTTEIVMDFARRWAKIMQYLLKDNCTNFDDIVTLSAVEANVDGEVTPAHVEKAIELLIETWEYGKNLQEWCNNGGKDIIATLF